MSGEQIELDPQAAWLPLLKDVLLRLQKSPDINYEIIETGGGWKSLLNVVLEKSGRSGPLYHLETIQQLLITFSSNLLRYFNSAKLIFENNEEKRMNPAEAYVFTFYLSKFTAWRLLLRVLLVFSTRLEPT